MKGQPVPPDDQQGKQQQDQTGSNEAQLLTDHRENKVVLGLGQVQKLLPPVAQPQAGDPAGANGHQGLDGLHTLVQGIVPGVQPCGNSGGHVVRPQDDDRQGRAHGYSAGHEPAHGDAAGKQNGRRDDHHLDGGGHVVLHRQDADHHQDDKEIGDQLKKADALQKVAKPAHGGVPPEAQGGALVPSGQPGGKVEDEPHFAQLGGLPLHRVFQPPGGAADLDAQAGNFHRQHQQAGHHQNGHRQAPQALVVQPGDQVHNAKPQKGVDRLALKIIEWVSAGVSLQVVIGRRVGGRQKHNQANDHQKDRQQHKGHIHLPLHLPRSGCTPGFFGAGFQKWSWHERIPPGSAPGSHRTGKRPMTPKKARMQNTSEMPAKTNTTFFSLQPPISRWWWRGAMRKIRLPWVALK